jgi:hypothetical protein
MWTFSSPAGQKTMPVGEEKLQEFINHAHHSIHAAHNGTHRCHKTHHTSALFLDERLNGRHLVVEVHAGKAAAGPGGQVAHVLGYGILVTLYFGIIEKSVACWDDLDIILVHAVSILQAAELAIQHTLHSRVLVAKAQTINGMCDVELVECKRY